MKKFLILFIATFCFAMNVSAQGIVWRGTHKVCGNGATLTLHQTGKMVFYYDYQTYEGRYSIENGYLNLYENDRKIFSFPYSFNDRAQTLYWVDVKGVRLNRCN